MVEDKKTIPAADVTPAMIADWKQKHGSVFKFTNDNGKVAYFRKPDLKVLDASAALGKTNPLQSNQLIANTCFLAGDRELLDNPDDFLGLNKKISALIVSVEGELLPL